MSIISQGSFHLPFFSTHNGFNKKRRSFQKPKAQKKKGGVKAGISVAIVQSASYFV